LHIFRTNQLIHSKQFNNEIHIKIGGDHGGGSFTMNYQICNTFRLNSKDNTVVFSIFEAKDYRNNLKLALSRFLSQIDKLQVTKWEYVLKYPEKKD